MLTTYSNKILSTSLDTDEEISLRGYVDMVDEIDAIEGWALDLADLNAILPVELCLAEQVVAVTKTGIARDDLSGLLGTVITPGFRFGNAALRMAAAEAKAKPFVPLEIRIGGTRLGLGAGRVLPTAGRVARLMADADIRNSAEQRLSLHALLLRLADQANDLVAFPSRQIPENSQGFIEMITVNPAGYVWFVGWMNKGHLLEFSGVVVDRGKTPSGVALLCYERSDLSSHACGIVGVIASDWQPNTLSQDFAIFFGKDARLYLQAHRPLRVVPAAEFIAEFERIRAECRNDRRGPAIMRLLSDMEHWSVTKAAAQGFVAYSSIDRLLLVPGFGYLAEGWVISPAKRVDHLQLRVEGKTLRCAMETLFYKARNDLLDAHPSQRVLVKKAGFVACFLGEVTSEDVSEPTLKLVFEDGGTWNQPIPPDVVRQLGHSATLDDLRMFYPTIEDEPFFPRLVAALRPGRPNMPLRQHAIARVQAAIIFMLPPDRCDLVLLFADVAERFADGNPEFGVAFIATSASSRPDAVRLFGEFARSVPGKASLFFAEDEGQPFDLIPPALEATRALRFVFAGPGVFLSPGGWTAAAEVLAITQPPAPFHPIARGRAGPELLATILEAKFGQHLPLNRQSDTFAREGIDLDVSTLADWVGACTATLAPLTALILAHVMAAERLHGDDTTVPVLARGRTTTGRLWTYVRDDRPFAGPAPPAAVFFYSPDRTGQHPRRHLGAYTGILQADAYAGFADLYRDGRHPGSVIEAGCWAHGRRKLFELAEIAHAPLTVEAVRRIDAIFAVERTMIGMPISERAALRQVHVAPLVTKLEAWMRDARGKMSRHADVARAMDYMLKRWGAFARFLGDGRIDLTNNAAERALRGIALGRKAWLFAGSDRGGERAAAIYSLIVTAKLNNVDPRAWLGDVLRRIADHPASKLHELLPWNWIKPDTSASIAA